MEKVEIIEIDPSQKLYESAEEICKMLYGLSR